MFFIYLIFLRLTTVDDARVVKAIATVKRIQHLPLSLPQRAILIETVATAQGLYGILTNLPSVMSRRDWRQAVLRTLWPSSSRRRCPEIVLALVVPGHKIDPEMAATYSYASAWCRAGLWHDPTLHRIWKSNTFLPRGLLSMLAVHLGHLQWEWEQPGILRTANGPLQVPNSDDKNSVKQFLHIVRATLRAHLLAYAARRKDMKDIRDKGGIDEFRTTRWLRSKNHGAPTAYTAGVLRALLAGAIWNRCRLHVAGLLADHELVCRRCWVQNEDMEHMLWQCPANQLHQRNLLGDLAQTLQTEPRTTRHGGLVHKEQDYTIEQVEALQRYLCVVIAERNACDQEAMPPGDDVAEFPAATRRVATAAARVARVESVTPTATSSCWPTTSASSIRRRCSTKTSMKQSEALPLSSTASSEIVSVDAVVAKYPAYVWDRGPSSVSGCFSVAPSVPYRGLESDPWMYDLDLLAACKAYFTNAGPQHKTTANHRGTTWIEMAIDFQLSTGIGLPRATDRTARSLAAPPSLSTQTPRISGVDLCPTNLPH